MAYQNTGYARCMTLTVTKGEYSQTYNITDAIHFGNRDLPAITPEQFARLTRAEYQDRLNLFCSYVYFQESGLQDDCPDLTEGASYPDPDTCKI